MRLKLHAYGSRVWSNPNCAHSGITHAHASLLCTQTGAAFVRMSTKAEALQAITALHQSQTLPVSTSLSHTHWFALSLSHSLTHTHTNTSPLFSAFFFLAVINIHIYIALAPLWYTLVGAITFTVVCNSITLPKSRVPLFSLCHAMPGPVPVLLSPMHYCPKASPIGLHYSCMLWLCKLCLYSNTVEPRITDPLTEGQPLYKGHWLRHRLNLL